MIKHRLHGRQKGISVIGLVITLLVVGYGAFIAIQYLPQIIEAQTIESIFDTLRKENDTEKFNSAGDLKNAWSKLLNINEMNELKDSIEIDQYGGKFTIKVSYDRELDLLYKKKMLHYEKTTTLNQQ
jgi:hypothetical protein